MTSDDNIADAVSEAERFLRRVKEYRKERKTYADVLYLPALPSRAAMLRASMDLTRALATLRSTDR